MVEHEPRLCPDCPRKSYVNMVRSQSYTTTPTTDPNVKLCAKLRALDLPGVPQCPYFSKNEKITNFIGEKKMKPKRDTCDSYDGFTCKLHPDRKGCQYCKDYNPI